MDLKSRSVNVNCMSWYVACNTCSVHHWPVVQGECVCVHCIGVLWDCFRGGDLVAEGLQERTDLGQEGERGKLVRSCL